MDDNLMPNDVPPFKLRGQWKRKAGTDGEPPPGSLPPRSRSLNLFAPENRGMLLDIFVFLMNVFLMRRLSRLFLDTARNAMNGDFPAGVTMFLYCLAIFMLLPVGAVLKRPHFHERLKSQGKDADDDTSTAGCLFNPIIYFCLNIIIYCALNAFAIDYLYGDVDTAGGGIFVSSIFFGIFAAIAQTFFVYRFFYPPKSPPRTEFMRGPYSEQLGDACIFLNMILFQILWNIVTALPMFEEHGIKIAEEVIYRLVFLFFIALFVYFPPRIFYLAEDIGRKRAWLTILLANSPVILRVIFGSAFGGL